ncbi:unnamed protein product [Trichobilharzia regenti]|nr:unnamed protein product [Trichobilharzia regenti]
MVSGANNRSPSTINGLNQAHIQCPVLFRTLKLPLLPQSTNISQCEAMGFVNNSENLSSENNNSSTEHTDQINPDQIPHVYVSCGHVHGWHNWRAASDIRKTPVKQFNYENFYTEQFACSNTRTQSLKHTLNEC